MSKVKDLLSTLSQAEQEAVQIVRTALDCFNSKDGSGLFTGVERYAVLTARTGIAAVQSVSLSQFWANLLRRMMWGVPPRKFDGQITECLTCESPHEVIRILATQTSAIVMLARMVHTEEKPKVEYVDAADLEEDLLS